MNLYTLFSINLFLVVGIHMLMWRLRRDGPILLQLAYTFAIAVSGFFLLLIVKAVSPLNDYFILSLAILYGVFMYDGAFKRSLIESDKKLNKNDR
jgi:accessory gene regulator protein AgrB